MAVTPRIIVLSEQLRGQSFELVEGEYSIGRTDACDICIPDPTISGHHCTLVRMGSGTYGARDEGSTNGTRVNGVRLEPEDVQPLVHSDILQVGGVEMLFDCESTRSDGSTTQTVINLEERHDSEPVTELVNLGGGTHGTRRGGLHREDRKQSIIVWAVFGVLALVALVALGIFVVKVMGSS
ncbi:MAG: FHA domain-containing protein [Lentisphaeria bacterium]|nr:FHA domain-containing protein [Lentisphaeria bacterium]